MLMQHEIILIRPNNESVIVHQSLSLPSSLPMNNSKLCNILEVGSRVALRERLEVFWECSQVGKPGVIRPFGELLPLENHSQTWRIKGEIVLRDCEYILKEFE